MDGGALGPSTHDVSAAIEISSVRARRGVSMYPCVTRYALRVTIQSMPDDQNQQAGRKDIKIALTFGVVAATVQMGVLLWLMYC